MMAEMPRMTVRVTADSEALKRALMSVKTTGVVSTGRPHLSNAEVMEVLTTTNVLAAFSMGAWRAGRVR